jgi:hypothetical protein
VNRAVIRVAETIAAKTCANPRRARWVDGYGQTLTPRISTPLFVARSLSGWFEGPHGYAAARSAVFGVAARDSLVFEGGNTAGASFGVISLACS